MAECKRITPEEIVEAYRKTGLKVTRGRFFGDGCACGFGAYAAAKLGVSPVVTASDPVHFVNAAVHRAMINGGFTREYRAGFIDGFDGDEAAKVHPHYNLAQYETGYADGAAAYAAASKEAGRA